MASTLLQSVINYDPISINFPIEAFDNDANDQGVGLVHYKAVPCAGSDADRGSMRSTHREHDCENGFYYKLGGKFKGVLSNNPSSKIVKPEGILDTSICYIILPRFYADTQQQMYFATYDKIDFAVQDSSIWVPYWEKITHSQVGTDRARFPIAQIEYIIGPAGKQYTENVDFKIQNGVIVWISQNRPGFNQMSGEGVPYSVRYLYKPSFFVNKIIHQIRLLNTFDPSTGEKKEIRFPSLLECVREVEFENISNSTQYDSLAEEVAPPSGANFGPK